MGRGVRRTPRPGRLSHVGALGGVGLLVLAAGCGAGAPASPGPGRAQATATSNGLVVHVEARSSSPAGTAQVTVRAEAAHAPGALGYDVRFGDGTAAHNVVPQFCVAGPGPHRQATWHLTHHYARAGTHRLSVSVRINCTTTVATARLALGVG